MSALTFLTSGGMASIGGDLPQEEHKKMNKPAQLFGKYVRELALINGIPASAVNVVQAGFLMAAKDKVNALFIFAESLDGTKIHYQDLSKFGVIPLEKLTNDVRMQVGNPIFEFSIPLEGLENEQLIEQYSQKAAALYINNILKQFQKESESEGEIDSKLCFVIMSFSNNPQLQDFYEMAIKPTIEEFGFICERVDEQEFNGSIKDKILQNIRKAKFIVADVTEARPNCYYELGIAHALSKNVIHIANTSDDIHFDINDFNFIIYSRVAELKERLKSRIESTVL